MPPPRLLARVARLALCALLLLPGIAAAAVDAASPALGNYYREAWTTRSGLPHNSVYAIAQTPDGYLWLGTWEGAVRFNGREFVTFDRKRLPELADAGVRALQIEADGSLTLAGGRGSLFRLARGKGEALPPAPTLVTRLLRDSHGRLWVGSEGAGLLRIEANDQRQLLETAHGLPAGNVSSLAEDAQGRIWVGTIGGLARFDAAGLQAVRLPGLPEGPVHALLFDDRGRMLVAGERGVFRQAIDGDDAHFELLDAGLQREAVTTMLQDRRGELWFGTLNSGLLRLGQHGLERLDNDDGLPNNRVLSLAEDSQGGIWVGTNGGLLRLSDAPFASLTRKSGLADDFVRTVLEHSDGSLWIGGSGGIDRLRGDRIEHIAADQRWPQLSVLSLAEARNGDVWTGTYTHGALRWRDGKVVEVRDRSHGLPGNHVRALLETADGELWVGTTSGLAHVRGDEVRSYTRADGLPGQYVVSLLESRHGGIWIGTATGAAIVDAAGLRRLDLSSAGDAQFVFHLHESADGHAIWMATDRGLLRYRHVDGQLAAVDRRHGLPTDSFFAIVDDGQGGFWLSSNRGVVRIDAAAAEAVADGRQARLEHELFTEKDGMASAQCNGSSSPAAAVRADGSVWIATAAGLAHVHPRRLAQFSDRPPPVAIETFVVDDRALDVRDGLSLPPGSQRIEMNFAGIDFVMAQRIRYRYRLQGFDQDWVERGSQPYAQFTNLAPGDYELRVSAAHPNGRWNEQEARLQFRIEPHLWQRAGFQAAVLFALVLLVWAGLRWRIRSLHARARQLHELVEARTGDLRQQTERLLAADAERSQLVEQLRQKSEAFERQAREDALTGLMNRRAFDEALELEFARAERAGHPLCLAILDLDHFKRVNDNWSHAVGDEALKAVAEVMRKQFRSIDSLARWGGEEFAMLLPYTGPEHARAACERLRAAVAAIDCSPFAKGLKLSVSIGVASQHGVANHDKLLSLADAALYRAKEGGRNQVCAAMP